MKKIYFALFLVVLVSSCELPLSDFKIDQTSESRLLVYAFPSDADDYLVNVSMTKSIYNELNPLQELHVTCTTNGMVDEVTLLNVETHHQLPIAVFKAHGKHRSGDEIRIKVDCKGVPSAEASTTIPKSTDFTMNNVSETRINNQQYRVFKIGFHDEPATDFYAVRVMSYVAPYDYGDEDFYYEDESHNENTDIYNDGSYYYGQGGYTYYHISTEREPLLQNYVDLNLDSWDQNYQCMYIFNDKKFSSPEVDMHLYAESCYGKNVLQFYTLSAEYYEMLDRLNSQLNNELGSSGLSQIYSTFNNVKGGYGCVAGYTMRTHEYVVGSGSGDIYF